MGYINIRIYSSCIKTIEYKNGTITSYLKTKGLGKQYCTSSANRCGYNPHSSAVAVHADAVFGGAALRLSALPPGRSYTTTISLLSPEAWPATGTVSIQCVTVMASVPGRKSIAKVLPRGMVFSRRASDRLSSTYLKSTGGDVHTTSQCRGHALMQNILHHTGERHSHNSKSEGFAPSAAPHVTCCLLT